MLRCPFVILTWYPGAYPASGSPLVLLSTSHRVPEGSPFAGAGEGLVQRADYVRGDAPAFFPRGNRSSVVDWTEVREIKNPSIAAETALALLAGLPTVAGWLRIQVTGRDTEWMCNPATIRGVRWDPKPRQGQLHLRWSVDCGPVAIHDPGLTPPTIYTPGEIILGPASINRGAILLGPNREHPEPDPE